MSQKFSLLWNMVKNCEVFLAPVFQICKIRKIEIFEGIICQSSVIKHYCFMSTAAGKVIILQINFWYFLIFWDSYKNFNWSAEKIISRFNNNQRKSVWVVWWWEGLSILEAGEGRAHVTFFFCFCTVICLLSYLPLLALLSLFTLSLGDDTKWPTSVNVSQTNKTSGKPHFFTCLYFFLLFKFVFIACVCLFFGRLGAERKHLAYWKRTKKKKKERFLKQCQNIDIALDNMVSEK